MMNKKNDWVKTTLGSISINNGQYGANEPATTLAQGNSRYIRITDIDEYGQLINEGAVGANIDKFEQYLVDYNDLLFVRTGSTTGKCYIHRTKVGTYTFAGFLIKYKIDERKADPYFIWILTKTKDYDKWTKTMSVRSGQPGINSQEYSNLSILLPTLVEQKKIAEILSTWDEAIDLQTKLINEKKVFLSNLALSLVKNHKSLVNFESSWGRVSLFDVYAERKEYGYQDENFELYSLTIEDGVTAKTNRYNREFLVKGDKKKYKITKYHDLVFNPQNLRYGAIALNYNQCPILLSPIYATLYIKDQNKYDVEYFNFLLTSQEMFNYYDSIAEGTLIERMTVKPEIFLKQEFNIPPIEEQRKISMMLIEMRNEISILEKELELKKLQKQGLMQQLLTGKIRVNIK